LVEAARDVGFEFLEAAQNETVISTPSGEEKYKVLHVITFNSTRKRMSVIFEDLQQNGKVRMYTKGADTIMAERMVPASVAEFERVEKKSLIKIAESGLRTLVMASKDIPQAEFAAWDTKYRAAKAFVGSERKYKMEQEASEMERGLTLVGCSAIEDKLQDGVPETIFKIREAGVKVWVLTGDNRPTAENIGASCKLLSPEMDPYFRIVGALREGAAGEEPTLDHSFEGVKENIETEMQNYARRVAEARGAGADEGPFAVVVTGAALVEILEPNKRELDDDKENARKGHSLKWTLEALQNQRSLEKLFLELAKNCSAVLCCRVSPLQKAKVVELVKRREAAITLAIGDGANDVSMIKAAHIGIGISGLEGRQAVQVGDTQGRCVASHAALKP
jgi:magnesium-transporting ATPase (P-type)